MATIEEEMKEQIAKEKYEKMKVQELEARMKMYQDIASIKGWVKFFGILAIIGIICIILGIA